MKVHEAKVESLIPYARNSRTHSDAQVAQIAASIREFGFTNPVLVDEADGIIAGHGRVLAARKLGLEDVPAIRLSHLSETQKRAYIIADNRLALNAGWDEEMLSLELGELKNMNFDVDLLGFDAEELDSLLDGYGGGEGDVGDGERVSTVLDLMDVTIADPKHVVVKGDVWKMGEKHVLLCECVLTGWPIWSPRLVQDAVFCPYPGPFVALSKRAKKLPFVLVQPDSYIAGHILDRYAEIHGEESVRKENA